MKAKAVITIAIFALLILFVSQFIHNTEANGVWAPTKPNTDQPALAIQSPINNYIYTGDFVPLNLTVIKPASWGEAGDPNTYYWSGIAYVHYILDGITYSLFEAQLINPIPQDLLPAVSNFSASLKGLSNGAHILKVIVYALNQWCPTSRRAYGFFDSSFLFL